MENKNIRVDGGHFRGLTRPVHADGGAVPCHPTKCRPVPLEGRHFSRETFEKTASPSSSSSSSDSSHQPNLDSANTPRTSLRIDTNRASQIYVSSLGRHDDIMTFDESYVSRRSNCLFRFSSRPSRTLSS